MIPAPHIMAYSNQPCTINIPADVIERCESSFDMRNFTHLSLLRAILAIRACGGRYKRAYKTLEEIGIPIPIVVYVVKKICKILGCGNLDTNISHDDTMRAFDQFLQMQHPESYSPLPVINNNTSNSLSNNMNGSINQWNAVSNNPNHNNGMMNEYNNSHSGNIGKFSCLS